MKALLAGAAAIGMATAPAAMAQTADTTTATTTTVTTPVAPPATLVDKVAPGVFTVTHVPGIAVSSQLKVQNFGDYDLNNDGAYSPMEFAQAVHFMASGVTTTGTTTLPAKDRYVHKGAVKKLPPMEAVEMLNVTADEFATVDLNNDWRVTADELALVAMI